LLLLSGCEEGEGRSSSSDANSSRRSFPATRLSRGDEGPEGFEAFLREHPEDEARRTAALKWYRHPKRDRDQLKYHTLRMIEYHPNNMYIFFANEAAFFLDPRYRLEVIRLLEQKLRKGYRAHGVYANLALICVQGAIPPVDEEPESSKELLSWYELPHDVVLPTQLDKCLARKAVRYLRAAIKTAGEQKWRVGAYAWRLARLLVRMERTEEAVSAFQLALPHVREHAKPGFLLSYGRALRVAGRIKEAKGVLGEVRVADSAYEDGPSHPTMAAEQELGLIALREGRLDQAAKCLLASTNVKMHRDARPKAFPLELARKLLKKGEYDAVAKYCCIVLEKFTPGQKQTEELLQRAIEAREVASGTGKDK